jgi:ABC transporter DrrB family efflux protein
MTSLVAPPRPVPGPMTPARALTDTVGIAQRNLRRMVRTPQLLFFSAIQPILFVLLFRYVFGGSIKGVGGSYVNYLMPAIFVQVVLFGGSQTAVGMATDLQQGVIDRFRTLPMARSAVLAGRTLADLVRNVGVVGLMVVIGVLVGFRFRGSLGADIGALLLVLAFGYAFSWVYVAVGLAVRDPETAQVAAFAPLFVLVFASDAFVPVANMPGWLQGFATYQPVSVVVSTARGLLNGMPAGHWLWQAAAWTIGILVVSVFVSVRMFSRAAS